jgi:hypothetical protein
MARKQQANICIFYLEKENENHELDTGFFTYIKLHKYIRAGNRVPYIILRGRWCDLIVLSVQTPTEDKMDDMKDSCYEN